MESVCLSDVYLHIEQEVSSDHGDDRKSEQDHKSSEKTLKTSARQRGNERLTTQ